MDPIDFSIAGQTALVTGASHGIGHDIALALAPEWAPKGVTVNAVAPTSIRTPGTAERLDQPEQ